MYAFVTKDTVLTKVGADVEPSPAAGVSGYIISVAMGLLCQLTFKAGNSD